MSCRSAICNFIPIVLYSAEYSQESHNGISLFFTISRVNLIKEFKRFLYSVVTSSYYQFISVGILIPSFLDALMQAYLIMSKSPSTLLTSTTYADFEFWIGYTLCMRFWEKFSGSYFSSSSDKFMKSSECFYFKLSISD